MELRGSHSVCNAHEAFELVRFHGAFRECLGIWSGGPLWRSQRLYCLGSLGVGCFVAFTAVEAFGLPPPPPPPPLFVAFRVLVVFMGHYGGTLVAFTVLVQCMGLWGWTSLVAFTVFFCFLFWLMECLGWMLVKFTAFVVFMRRSGWSCSWRWECS